MKHLSMAILMLTLVSLMASYFLAQRVYALDFEAFVLSTTPTLDGTITDGEWSDAGHYTVAIDPSGTAEIWTKHDSTDLYMAIEFTADSTTPWVSLQLGTTGCMDNGADGIIFGDTNAATTGYTDIHFGGTGGWGNGAVADATQNGAGAMHADATTKLVEIEFKKPLNSGDTAGHDIAWTVGNTFDLVIAWDSNGGGNPGDGAANHKTGTTPTARTMLISPNAVPEFPGWVFLAVLLVLVVPVAILAKKMIRKPTMVKKL